MTTRRNEELEKLRSMLPEEMPTSESILYSNDRVIDADKNAYILALGKAVDMAEAMSEKIEEQCALLAFGDKEAPVFINNDLNDYTRFLCPRCKTLLFQRYSFIKPLEKINGQPFCHKCGQKLSWELAEMEV